MENIRDRYIKEYQEWQNRDSELKSNAQQDQYAKRDTIIDSMGFENWEGRGRNVFTIYHVGMIAKVTDQDFRFVGHISVPATENEINAYIYKLNTINNYCKINVGRLRYTHIHLGGNVEFRLKWIKNMMEKTTWREKHGKTRD